MNHEQNKRQEFRAVNPLSVDLLQMKTCLELLMAMLYKR